MISLVITIAIALIVSAYFIVRQAKFSRETNKSITLYEDFFKTESPYSVQYMTIGGEKLPQLVKVGVENSDLNRLIGEINYYIEKTKGTTVFSIIQNKIERKLGMRYDQSVAKLSFPTYIGLMGTFSGVFIGLLMFVIGLHITESISDSAIKNLIIGVLVSMLTSLCGLVMSTKNTARIGDAKKRIEEDKNVFYDFIQTELMPNIDASMEKAITKLHETVDKFEPSFDRIITRFQDTFDSCTKAFGKNFEKQVKTVSDAVHIMGTNMDKISMNIYYQEQLLTKFKSQDFIKGMDKYIEASEHFGKVANSLDKFEEARRMMLAAAQEAIVLQNTYNDSLRVPREIAVKVNSILDRMTKFEQSIQDVGESLTNREVLGNNVIEAIQRQVQGISKKSMIADKFLEMADNELENMYNNQTAVLQQMNDRYKEAIEGHIEGFETMIKSHTAQLETQHVEFMTALHEKFDIEEIKEEFTNLRKLEDIEVKISQMIRLLGDPAKTQNIQGEIDSVVSHFGKLYSEVKLLNINTKERQNNNLQKLEEIENRIAELISILGDSPKAEHIQNGIKSVEDNFQSLKSELVSINSVSKEKENANLRKLEDISDNISKVIDILYDSHKTGNLQKEIKAVESQLRELKTELAIINNNIKNKDNGRGNSSGLLGLGRR